MSLVTSVLLSVVASEGVNALPFPPIVFAGIAVAVFAALGFVVWSYRDVAHRQGKKSGGSAGHGSDHH